ncbi:hypothetical protein U1Q18_033195 [Sarracenia purpurea var. burkii]
MQCGHCQTFVGESRNLSLSKLDFLNDPSGSNICFITSFLVHCFRIRMLQKSIEKTKLALPALACLVQSNDGEVLPGACWALSYLSNGTNDTIQAVIEAGVGPLVELLL